MVFAKAGTPLSKAELPQPVPGPGQVRLRIHACGVCRTDLHIVDGELTEPKLPLVLGHQIVGTVVELGPGAERFEPGRRVGVPWLAWTCGVCRYCREGRFIFCPTRRGMGHGVNGAFARYVVVRPDQYVAAVLPLDGHDELNAFFGRFMH